jgi:hypothetical protein
MLEVKLFYVRPVILLIVNIIALRMNGKYHFTYNCKSVCELNSGSLQFNYLSPMIVLDNLINVYCYNVIM